MKVSIHQPAYLPWLGYFEKIRDADLFIYLDTVQFQKNSFQNRNKIRTAQGSTWLTVPVESKGTLQGLILNDVRINNRVNWLRKHRMALEMNYRKAPFFDSVFPHIGKFYETEWELLSELCFQMLMEFVEILKIDTKIIRSSEMPEIGGAKSDLVLNLCKETGATEYFSGSLGADYLRTEDFDDAGIKVTFQDYQHPVYRQTYPGFEPYMGIVDLLFNEADPASII